ncbi:MAG: Abortive infection protein [Acidimicrobiaceae bacterium]|nr:Abortive infection protein [Acidimicrobiaceae bacterium]
MRSMPDDGDATVPPRGANSFGLIEAALGLAAAELLAALAVAAYGAATGHPARTSDVGTYLVDLVGVWAGFLGAVLLASISWHRRNGDRAGRSLFVLLRDDYGLALSPWPDIPLGVAVGLASQYALVPALEAPLLPFVPHLYQRLGGPAHQVTGTGHGASLVVLGLFLCIGSPFVEELFFRGLVLRALVGRLARFGQRIAGVLGVVITGLVFGLVHFEALQFLGLAGFGIALSVLARRTGRLGPGMVAHLTFNAVTVISLALAR